MTIWEILCDEPDVMREAKPLGSSGGNPPLTPAQAPEAQDASGQGAGCGGRRAGGERGATAHRPAQGLGAVIAGAGRDVIPAPRRAGLWPAGLQVDPDTHEADPEAKRPAL
jgi:hypothetical protein